MTTRYWLSWREDGRDLALAEGVVKGVVDICGKNAEARRGVAVDDEGGQEALVLLVAGDIANGRERLQFVHETGRPVGQLFGVDVFEAVLEFGAADAVFDGRDPGQAA